MIYDFVTLSTTNDSMDTVVELQCIPGYEWDPPHNETSHFVQCQRFAKWNATLPDCHRECELFLL